MPVYKFNVGTAGKLAIFSETNVDPWNRALDGQNRYLAFLAHGHFHQSMTPARVTGQTVVQGVDAICFQVAEPAANTEPNFIGGIINTAFLAHFPVGCACAVPAHQNVPNFVDWPTALAVTRNANVRNYLMRKEDQKQWGKHSERRSGNYTYIDETYLTNIFAGNNIPAFVDIM